MQFIKEATHGEVMDAFQYDSLVEEALQGKPWPSAAAEKAAVLRKARRPVDRILASRWQLYSLDRDDLLDGVKWIGTLRETIALYEDGKLPDHHQAKVKELVSELPAKFRDDRFRLICYRGADGVLLEEGHHHAVAALITYLIPPAVGAFVEMS